MRGGVAGLVQFWGENQGWRGESRIESGDPAGRKLVIALWAVVHTDVWGQTHWAGDTGGPWWSHGVRNGPSPAEPQLAWFMRDLSRVVGDVLVRAQGSGYIHRRRDARCGAVRSDHEAADVGVHTRLRAVGSGSPCEACGAAGGGGAGQGATGAVAGSGLRRSGRLAGRGSSSADGVPDGVAAGHAASDGWVYLAAA